MSYNGKIAVVTGGGSGMGRLAAQRCARAGAQVAALDVNEVGLGETAEGEKNIFTQVVDVTEPLAVDDAVARIEADLGPVDRVFHAAAIMPLGRILDQDIAVIHKIMAINYGGLVNMAKAVVPPMLERGRGDFVSFASLAGWFPTIYVGAYNASKFATVAFTEVLAHENRGRGVRFTCVCPPPVATPLLQQGRDTVWPKLFDEAPPIEPTVVLDAIENSLERGELMCFPTSQTKWGWRMRRWFPELMWKQVHKIEGV